MRILITANSHRWYDRTGTINRKIGPIGGRTFWTVRLDSGEVTTVSDGQFREVKRQDRPTNQQVNEAQAKAFADYLRRKGQK